MSKNNIGKGASGVSICVPIKHNENCFFPLCTNRQKVVMKRKKKKKKICVRCLSNDDITRMGVFFCCVVKILQ